MTILNRLLVVCILICTACGSDRNPYTITGQVYLHLFPDGGSEVDVDAVVNRVLEDGGAELAGDADVALNDAQLGPAEASDGGQVVDGGMSWTFSSFTNAVQGAHQVLSVVGANPPATVEFTCPHFSIIAPAENTIFPLGVATVQWTPGQYAYFDESYAFSAAQYPATIPLGVLLGFGIADPDVTSVDFDSSTFPWTGRTSLSVTIFIAGDTPDSVSDCLVDHTVDFYFQ